MKTLPIGRVLDRTQLGYVQVREVKDGKYACEGCVFDDGDCNCKMSNEERNTKYGSCWKDTRIDKKRVRFVHVICDKREVSREVAKRALRIYSKSNK